MTKEQLLAEIDDLLRTMPPINKFHEANEENLSWLGRAMAILNQWDILSAVPAQGYVHDIQSIHSPNLARGFKGLMILLHRARHDLMMETVGPLSVVVSDTKVFDYFDEIRKIIVIAQNDILFVDPYLDADFVSRYLPHIPNGVRIRLLAREKIKTLLPAVQEFAKQNQSTIEIRSAPGFHDRYVFVDGSACYQSGASFKDGGRKAPTTITQITDAFSAMSDTYEKIWQSGKIEF